MLNDHVVAFILVCHSELSNELMGGLAHHHGGEELAAKPSTTCNALTYQCATNFRHVTHVNW